MSSDRNVSIGPLPCPPRNDPPAAFSGIRKQLRDRHSLRTTGKAVPQRWGLGKLPQNKRKSLRMPYAASSFVPM
jgi:hypothetical protein